VGSISGMEVSVAKAVAKKAQSTELRVVDDFEGIEGLGMENVGANDLLVPRLSILQALSPQIDDSDAAYIEGAKQGQICDVGTSELYADGVLFLPVFYRKDYLEWAPRASGQGLVGIHSDPAILDQCTRNERNQPVLPNGNYVAETAQFFGLNLSADNQKCFIPMASTQLKKARKWLTMATGEKLQRADGSSFTPPLFYRSYSLTTAKESNNDGSWFGWKIERGDALPDIEGWQDMKADCMRFLEALKQGEAKADTSHMDGARPAPAGGEEAM